MGKTSWTCGIYFAWKLLLPSIITPFFLSKIRTFFGKWKIRLYCVTRRKNKLVLQVLHTLSVQIKTIINNQGDVMHRVAGVLSRRLGCLLDRAQFDFIFLPPRQPALKCIYRSSYILAIFCHYILASLALQVSCDSINILPKREREKVREGERPF